MVKYLFSVGLLLSVLLSCLSSSTDRKGTLITDAFLFPHNGIEKASFQNDLSANTVSFPTDGKKPGLGDQVAENNEEEKRHVGNDRNQKPVKNIYLSGCENLISEKSDMYTQGMSRLQYFFASVSPRYLVIQVFRL
ncbi:MAG: hypothetical protein RIC15_09350 [Vicingaceae bacterium]